MFFVHVPTAHCISSDLSPACKYMGLWKTATMHQRAGVAHCATVWAAEVIVNSVLRQYMCTLLWWLCLNLFIPPVGRSAKPSIHTSKWYSNPSLLISSTAIPIGFRLEVAHISLHKLQQPYSTYMCMQNNNSIVGGTEWQGRSSSHCNILQGHLYTYRFCQWRSKDLVLCLCLVTSTSSGWSLESSVSKPASTGHVNKLCCFQPCPICCASPTTLLKADWCLTSAD